MDKNGDGKLDRQEYGYVLIGGKDKQQQEYEKNSPGNNRP